MNTDIVNLESDNGSAVLIGGLILVAIIVAAAVYFSLPYFPWSDESVATTAIQYD